MVEPTEQTLNAPVCIHCEKDCAAKGIKPEKKKLSKFFCLAPDCPNLHSYYCSNCIDYHEHKAHKIAQLLEVMLKAGEEIDKFHQKITACHQKAMKEKNGVKFQQNTDSIVKDFNLVGTASEWLKKQQELYLPPTKHPGPAGLQIRGNRANKT